MKGRMDYNQAILLLGAASQIINIANKARETAGQSREWTPEQEAAFDQKLTNAKEGKYDHWKVEPDPK